MAISGGLPDQAMRTGSRASAYRGRIAYRVPRTLWFILYRFSSGHPTLGFPAFASAHGRSDMNARSSAPQATIVTTERALTIKPFSLDLRILPNTDPAETLVEKYS
jgi:hypothetical protein